MSGPLVSCPICGVTLEAKRKEAFAWSLLLRHLTTDHPRAVCQLPSSQGLACVCGVKGDSGVILHHLRTIAAQNPTALFDHFTLGMIMCRKDGCGKMAESAFYRTDQAQKPEWEWYRPGEEEIATLSVATKEHVQNGGLLIRAVAR